MGSYYIPSNKLKGETRILIIFTPKSLIFTAAGAFIGLIFYLILSAVGLKTLGLIIMVIFALIGYAVVSIKVPSNGATRLEKNVGGMTLFDIITTYMIFKKNRKIYSVAVPRKEPDYLSTTNESEKIVDTIIGKSNKTIKNKSTKEENR